jgi:hypothetical protein
MRKLPWPRTESGKDVMETSASSSKRGERCTEIDLEVHEP